MDCPLLPECPQGETEEADRCGERLPPPRAVELRLGLGVGRGARPLSFQHATKKTRRTAGEKMRGTEEQMSASEERSAEGE